MSWRALASAIAALVLGACSSTPYFGLESVTEDAVTELSFSASTEEMDLLRARYIVAGIALYGTHSVSEYSGEYRTADASRILNRTVEIMRLQDELGAATTNRYFRQIVRRVETLTLVDAAVQPTKRYYRQRLLSIFAGGPQAAIAAAETAFDALKGLAKIEVYRQAMLLDARLHAMEIAARPQPNREKIIAALQKTLEEIQGSVTCGKTGSAAEIRWWEGNLDRGLLSLICKNEGLPDSQRAYLTRVAMAVKAAKNDPLTPDKLVTDKDWEQPNFLIRMACEELTRLAGLKESQNPCTPYFLEFDKNKKTNT